MLKEITNRILNEAGELDITASANSSKTDFDFFIGKWRIKNNKLKSRLDNCKEWIEFEATQTDHKALNGLANMDHFYATLNGKSFEGMTIRLFNPKTKLWSIYWADSNTGVFDPPVVGSFENGIGHFYTKDIFQGNEILVKFQWDKTDIDNPVWSQAFSADNGETWEWNWYMYMSRMN
ncbi:MAG: hypothetical protein ABJA78_13525 [Ferruginibacter sp.]